MGEEERRRGGEEERRRGEGVTIYRVCGGGGCKV